MVEIFSPTRKHILLGLAYGTMAALLNAVLEITVYGNMSFHMGEVLVILCLINCGIIPALIASLLASLSLYLVLDNPFFFIILGLETFVIGLLLKRGHFALMADIIYWASVGMPLTYAILYFASPQFAYDNILLLLKQAINGLLYVSVASVLVPLLPSQWKVFHWTKSLPKLSVKIFEYLSIISAIAALTTGIVLVDRSVKDNELKLKEALDNKARQASAFITNYIISHKNSIDNLADSISHTPSMLQDPFNTITHTQERFPGFLTMLLADKNAMIIAGAPESFYKVLRSQTIDKQSIADRQYFIEPQKTGSGFISQVFRGRGFGNDVIVAVSAPYFKNNEFEGVIEGSLNLSNFQRVEEDIGQHHAEYFVLVDQNQRVIYSSKGLNIESLSAFEFIIPEESYSSAAPLLQIRQNGLPRDYFYSELESVNQWRVMILQDTRLINLIVQRYYLYLVIIFSVVCLLSFIFSKYLSKYLTKPLEIIVEDMSSEVTIERDIKKLAFTEETLSLKNRIEQTKQVYLDFQSELKNEVDKRTKALSEANTQLEKLAREDGLTGLLNRRAFDEALTHELKKASRLNIPLALALIDIDHFKNINDTWGHPVGDKCIQKLGQTLSQQMQRDTDIIARVGGEEFAILLHINSAENCHKILERCRKAVEEIAIPVYNSEIRFTISIGLSHFTAKRGTQATQVYSQVDNLLYQSKEAGRNRITFDKDS